MRRALLALLCSVAFAAPAAPVSEREIAGKVNDLLGRMTLEEKIGQLTQIGGLAFIPDALKPEDRVRKGQVGSILWLSEPKAINRLQKIAVEETRLKIPVIFGLDVVHGFKTTFPIPLAMAASWDPTMIERVQAIAAREARAAGLHWTFAPMVDIARDPRWGRMIEGAGEDPYLGSAIARAQVRGFQGTDVSQPDRVLACVKHFAAYGAAEGGRDYDSTYVADSQLWNVYLPPFKAALDAGAATFMSAYQDLNDVPATGNAFLLRDVLRKTWGFNGFVVSDANAVRDLVTHGFARDGSDAALKALSAGVDMDMASRTYLDNVAKLVELGKIPVSLIDDSVRPVLAAKFRLGLFDHPYTDETLMNRVLGALEHKHAARVAAQRSAVLLRNEGRLLPLAKDASRSVAVVGPLGDSENDMLGSWTTMGMQLSAVTLVQGIRNKLGSGARVEFAPGAEIAKTYPSMFDMMFGAKRATPWADARSRDEFDKAVALAKRSDIVVLALGEASMMSGELASQSTLDLPGKQQQLLEGVVATGKPVVLVLVNGRPLDISWATSRVPAILEAWHPGEEGGNAIADLLFGDATPGGKLPVTWPRNAGQIPVYYAHNLTHQPETGPQFKSRFWDAPSAPLYPFGYGLSYTTFAFSNVRVARDQVPAGESLEVTADVENTGDRPGDEVAQLYIHQQWGAASRPVRELKGFERIALGPHEKKTVRFTLGPPELSYWNAASKAWVQDASKFDVWVGSDSSAKLHAGFEVIAR